MVHELFGDLLFISDKQLMRTMFGLPGCEKSFRLALLLKTFLVFLALLQLLTNGLQVVTNGCVKS